MKLSVDKCFRHFSYFILPVQEIHSHYGLGSEFQWSITKTITGEIGLDLLLGHVT